MRKCARKITRLSAEVEALFIKQDLGSHARRPNPLFAGWDHNCGLRFLQQIRQVIFWKTHCDAYLKP
jgi:hypothetical protein